MAEQVEFLHSKLIDLKGCFSFEDDGFTFSTFGKKQVINYSEIESVTRDYYDRTKMLGITQSTPNQYQIALINGRELVLRVAHKEEDAYQRKLNDLWRKIYHINALGVGLTSKVRRDATTNRQRDIQFEKEKPVRDFTLEKAIQMLLEKCGMELNDLTDYKTAETHAKKQLPLSMDKNNFVELAKLISNYDEDVVSSVFAHVERYELYYQDKTKEYPHRGMNENTPKDMIRWFAMIDVLEERGYAEEIDWKEDAENIAASLNRIKEKMGIRLDTGMDLSFLDGSETLEELETERILNLIGINTVEQGYTLANIEIDGDSYVISLVPNKVYKQCEKLLRNAGFTVSSL